jgi:hypothetical protein
MRVTPKQRERRKKHYSKLMCEHDFDHITELMEPAFDGITYCSSCSKCNARYYIRVSASMLRRVRTIVATSMLIQARRQIIHERHIGIRGINKELRFEV